MMYTDMYVFFFRLKELLEDVTPFINDWEITDDLHSMITALESMEIFKNLGLLDMKCKKSYSNSACWIVLLFFISSNLHFTDIVREMFDNWDVVRTFLIDKIGITNEIALTLSQAKIDMISIFMQERGVISLKDTICSPEKLGDMLLFNNNFTADEVSFALCQLDDSQTQNIVITLMKNINFEYIFKNVIIGLSF